MNDIELFEKTTDYIVVCESPFEIEDEEGTCRATGQIAKDFFTMVVEQYKSAFE